MKSPLFALVFLSSCTGERTKIYADLSAHSWELTKLTIDGVDENLSQTEPEHRSLHFDGTRGFGSAGVNHFQLAFKYKDPNQISVLGTDSGMTEMDGPAHLIKLETTYFAQLAKVKTAEVNGAILIMRSENARLTFRGHIPLPPFYGDPSDTDAIDLNEVSENTE